MTHIPTAEASVQCLKTIQANETPRLWMLLDMAFFDVTGESHDPGVDPYIEEVFWNARHDLEALIDDVDQEALMSLAINADEGRHAFKPLGAVERLVQAFKKHLNTQIDTSE